MKKALITGFGPFGPYKFNPTGKIVRGLHLNQFGGHFISGREISVNVFPSPGQVHHQGYKLVRQAMDDGISCIISLGIDSSAQGFRFETIAQNLIDNEKYCSDCLNGQRVLADRPLRDRLLMQKNSINFPDLVSRFEKAGVPIEPKLSTDAGGYCCNALMYMVLYSQMRLKCGIPFVFCHVPCTPESIHGIEDFDPAKKLITADEIREGLRQILIARA